MTRTLSDKVRLNCRDCALSHGEMCQHEGHKQSYERKYGDSDFCGPEGRFFQRKSLFTRMQTTLTGEPYLNRAINKP